MSIDLKFVELTADVLKIFFIKWNVDKAATSYGCSLLLSIFLRSESVNIYVDILLTPFRLQRENTFIHVTTVASDAGGSPLLGWVKGGHLWCSR